MASHEDYKPDPDRLSHDLWNGNISLFNLPKEVYMYNAKKLTEGIYKGYKKNLHIVSAHSPDYKMLEHLRTNIHIFSAAKTFNQTAHASEVMHKINAATPGDIVKTKFGDVGVTTNKSQNFKEFFGKMNDQYNTNWLETEYQSAISGARNASLWTNIQEQKETLTMLVYHTDEQDTVCEICLPLDGLSAPVDDPIWDEIFPDNHFNCNCFVSQEDEQVEPSSDEDKEAAYDEATDNMDDMWMRNVGKTGEVFTKDHPYFEIPEQYRDFAKANFNLEIPNHDN